MLPTSDIMISVTKPVTLNITEPSYIVVAISRVLNSLGYVPSKLSHMMDDYAQWPYWPVIMELEPGRYCAHSAHMPGWHYIPGMPDGTYELPYTYLGHAVYGFRGESLSKYSQTDIANFLYYTITQIGGERGKSDCT